jgi:hypothetical protein
VKVHAVVLLRVSPARPWGAPRPARPSCRSRSSAGGLAGADVRLRDLPELQLIDAPEPHEHHGFHDLPHRPFRVRAELPSGYRMSSRRRNHSGSRGRRSRAKHRSECVAVGPRGEKLQNEDEERDRKSTGPQDGVEQNDVDEKSSVALRGSLRPKLGLDALSSRRGVGGLATRPDAARRSGSAVSIRTRRFLRTLTTQKHWGVPRSC